jgi:hypothetical protein
MSSSPRAISFPSTDQIPTLPSPTYSPLPSRAEWRICPSTADTVQGTGEDWVFSTSHIQVNLGPRDAWGLSEPVYGLGASVVGSIEVKGEHVANVAATVSFTAFISEENADPT